MRFIKKTGEIMSRDISKIDKNFNLKTVENKDGMKFFNVLDEPFRVYGVFMDEGDFCRHF